MSIHFHRIPVKEVKLVTHDCITVTFDVPAALQDTFRYEAGQSLTFRQQIGAEEVRRTYSLCSSPLENEWKVAIKKVEDGVFSGWAHSELKAGDIMEVMPPVGTFTLKTDPGHHHNYIAFAAGSGITPVLSLIKTTLAAEPNSSFTLVYGNRNRPSVIFFEELEALKNRYMERFSIIHILSRERTDTPLNAGRIDAAKLNELSALLDYQHTDTFFLCGPEQMIFTVRDHLTALNIPAARIRFELFTTAGSRQTRVKKETAATAKGPVSHVTMKIDGRSIDLQIPLNSDLTLLDAALQEGADLPYACKGGMCCTCKAKLTEGEVQMDVHWGLEEEEVKKGFILTCQSHPKTEKITVDFDVR